MQRWILKIIMEILKTIAVEVFVTPALRLYACARSGRPSPSPLCPAQAPFGGEEGHVKATEPCNKGQ